MSEPQINRDQARQRWQEVAIPIEALTHSDVQALQRRLDAALRSSNIIRNIRADRLRRTWVAAEERPILITCSAYYFDKREAVSIYPDGFVGFAGWADDRNIQPFLKAFGAWTDDLVSPEHGDVSVPVSTGTPEP